MGSYFNDFVGFICVFQFAPTLSLALSTIPYLFIYDRHNNSIFITGFLCWTRWPTIAIYKDGDQMLVVFSNTISPLKWYAQPMDWDNGKYVQAVAADPMASRNAG